jgi:hypothetical protein
VKAAAIALLALTACGADLDEQWELDHDRIIAVRATPPGILSGERAEVDALIGAVGQHPVERSPEIATVVSPMSLMGTVAPDAGKWYVTAPDAATLAAARTELGLAADAPVPLQVGVAYAGQTLLAFKTVFLGETRVNPSLDDMMIDGAAAPGSTTEIVVAPLTDVRLSVKADVDDTVNWLTSCGTMHDFDLSHAYLRIEPEDPQDGELVLVVRDPRGGVSWRVWAVRAER